MDARGEVSAMTYETILYEEEGAIGWLTLNRPDDGNMFTPQMCHEIRDCINDVRRETRTRVLVITGAGDRFFCIGGRKDGHGRQHALRRHAADAGNLREHRAAAEAGDRLGERLRGRRRPGAAGHVRSHDRQGKRGVPAGRADDGQLRRGLRHVVPRRSGRQEEGEGDVVPQSAAHARARRSRSGSSTRSCPTTSSRKRRARWRWQSRSAARSRSPRSKALSSRATAACRASPASRTTCCCGCISTPTNRTSWAKRFRGEAHARPGQVRPLKAGYA